MLKAIVFDFDGTIIDTETAWFVALRDIYKTYGVDLSLELYSGCIGTSLHTFNPYEYLNTHHNLGVDSDELRKVVRARHTELMQEEKIRPGVREYLEQAKEAGLKIGLASSSDREWVERHLKQLGLYDFFDCIRTANDVEKVKPDPALYRKTLEGLGVSVDEAVAIEDSPNGMRAAVAAGIACVVTPNRITALLEFEESRWRVEDLGQLAFTDVVKSMAEPLSRQV
ncbi:HAD family hydrolase [Gorillibacterium timonense]|uniref:HAD family hydrolase n=1 Tax=Gorillibacterium timonense TaxID=1689269 RepID=UPI00071DDF02|nr:HAD family hydrolase [Gorillibacterium timonense]